ncbi:MAG: hypothetical protein GX434_15195 [Peptococcaceae bacterium]|nr:hypothetical protein [Peptococcaceae bacterium]
MKLGDVAREVKITINNPLEEGLERYVGLEHLDPQELKIQRWGNIADGVTFNKKFCAGQILFGRRRAYQKKAAVADFDGICSGDITVIEAIEGAIVPELLPYIIQSDSFFEYAVSESAGSLSPRVKWKHLAEYELSLPDKDTQRKIAELMQAFDESVEAHCNTVLALRAIYSSSRIAFTDCTTVTIKDLARPDTDKSFIDGDWIEAEYLSKKGIRLIQTGNIGINEFIDKNDQKWISEATFDLLRCTEVEPGDILICRLADPVGRACVIPDLGTKMITAVDCTILKIDKSKYDADFIAYLLNTDEWLALCKRFSRGSTRQRITRSALGDLTIQVPSIDEQRAFAKKIAIIKDALLAEQAAIEKIKALKKETITKLISGGDTQ